MASAIIAIFLMGRLILMGLYENALKHVAIAEGGANFDIVNGKAIIKAKNRADSGGLTNMGITQGALNAAYQAGIVSHNDITKLTKAEVYEIYRVNYWNKSRADEMPWGVCLIHFDTAVNCGIAGAAKQLQKALNVCGNKVSVDGKIGPLTINAVLATNHKQLCDAYLQERITFYKGLVAKKPSQGAFLNGWLNRVEAIRNALP